MSSGLPFRAEHIGSLLRPDELREARAKHDEGGLSDEAMREIEDRTILDAIKLQEEVGLQCITDGEFRRSIYFGHFAAAVEGYEKMDAPIQFTDDSGERMVYRTDVVTGKLRRAHGVATEEYEFVRAHTDRTPKVTLPSPSGQHYFRFREGISDEVYPDLDEFLDDVARIFREEIADLGERGATYLQLDNVDLALLCDPAQREIAKQRGYDADDLVERYVKVTNDSLRDRPDGMFVGIHLCRGNNQGKWLGEGSYEWIAERVFGGLDLDAYFLEYDTERAGGFEPLRFMPADKHVVLGLVSSKQGALESRDVLLRRIEEASAYVDMDRLALSPQCGFASVEQGNPISVDDQRRKLELVVETAASVWGE